MYDVNPKLKYVIVLSSKERDSSGNFPNFEIDKQDSTRKIYTGSDVRMRSALKVAELYPNAEFIMVGGLLEEQGCFISKAEDMAYFMKKSFPNLNLRIINSKPSTRGNLIALIDNLKGKIKEGNFVLLSNDYHVARIAEFWKKLKETGSPNLPNPKFLTVSQLGLKEAAESGSEEYLLRLQREKEGLEALSKGFYKF